MTAVVLSRRLLSLQLVAIVNYLNAQKILHSKWQKGVARLDPKPPKKIRKKNKKSKNKRFLNRIQLPLSNQFEVLSGDEMETEEKKSTNKTEKIAPIVVTDMQKDIQKIITDLNVQCDIKIIGIGRKIFAKSIDDKKKIIKSLSASKINFFSHPDSVNKIFKVVLSGLEAIDTQELITSMQTTYNIAPSKVIMFNTNIVNKLYLCHFDRSNVNMKILNTIKVVYHHIIKWLPYKPKNNSPTQCYRCCMYGHGASTCSRFAVCMLCGGNHTAKECTVITPNNKNPIYKLCY